MKVGFIGGGNMAEAMIKGMVSSQYNCEKIFVFDRNDSKLSKLKSNYGINKCRTVLELVDNANVIILAVKPQGMADLIEVIKDYISESDFIVTVAAGIDTSLYEKLFEKRIAFARTIPNTPSSLGYGATGVYFNKNVTNDQSAFLIKMMETMGVVSIVNDEKEIDVIAAIASSGPAYYFQFMEHMVKAAEKRGLDKCQAKKLIAQTCLGAAEMVLNSNEDISTLRENVTSKNGITYEALNIFKINGLEALVDDAISANISRAEELSMEFSQAIL